jgi:hypothetical protein
MKVLFELLFRLCDDQGIAFCYQVLKFLVVNDEIDVLSRRKRGPVFKNSLRSTASGELILATNRS